MYATAYLAPHLTLPTGTMAFNRGYTVASYGIEYNWQPPVTMDRPEVAYRELTTPAPQRNPSGYRARQRNHARARRV